MDPSTFKRPHEDFLDLNPRKISFREENAASIPFSGCVQVYGEAGSGKTQLCMHLAAVKLSQVAGNILFICTQSMFPSGRLSHFIQSQGLTKEAMNRVFIEHIGDGESLEHFLTIMAERLAKSSKIVMLIIDSITACLRTEVADNRKKWLVIQRLGISFRHLQSIGVQCIIVNEVFDSSWQFSNNNTQDIQPIYQLLCRESTIKLPCLGLTSSALFDTVVWIRKLRDERELVLLRSPDCPLSIRGFKIVEHGIAFQ